MNLPEFKAWFEGFCENLDGTPDKKAWDKIKKKVGQIQDAPATTYPVFVDRWWNRPYYGPYLVGCPTATGFAANIGLQNYQNASNNVNVASQSYQQVASFNSADAFRDLGRIESRDVN